MKRAIFLVAALATAACAGQPAANGGKADRDVERFMHRYTEVWNTHDAATIARDFYRMGPSVEDQTASLRKQFDALVAQGYDKSDIHEIKGCITGPDLAWAGMHFSRLKADGTPLPPKDRASQYELKKFPDGWRITRLTGGDPAKPLQCPVVKAS